MDYGENLQRRRREYVEALEEERRKIQGFHRELPLCLQLVTQAIDACREQLSGTTTPTGQSESSVQTTMSEEGPVLQQQFNFIPMKRSTKSTSSSSSDFEETEQEDNINNDKSTRKSDWLRSVQLWNPHQTLEPPTPKQASPRKASSSLMEGKRNCSGAFKPFRREKDVVEIQTNSTTAVAVAAAASLVERAPPQQLASATVSSTADTVTAAAAAARSNSGSGGCIKELLEKEGQCSSSQRKTRRCWSPELHRRFLDALKQLGGAHVATPKQIRELMKVDGLTNDEVKSHLQKYRLHTKRPGSSNHSDDGNAQAPQFVVVGGIWVKPPPSEYSEAVAAATSSEEARLPLASPSVTRQMPRTKQLRPANSDDERGSHSCKGGAQSSSPSASCSAHTTTASPVC